MLLGGLLAVYTNCGQPFGPPSYLTFSSNVYGGSSEVSYEAFEKTVYQITRSNCISCHASTIQPYHASDDVRKAHDAVISNFKVNFTNIPKSRLVAKLRDEKHNCWSDCAENADEMEAAVEEWNEAIKDSGVTPAEPADLANYTDETDTLEREFMDPTNPLKSNTLKLNIDSATLKAPMVLMRPVGEDPYIIVPNNGANATLTATDTTAGTATISFTAPATGSYKVWGLVQGPADADNSFFVNVLNATNATVVGGAKQFDITPVAGPKLEWKQVSNLTANLTKGAMYKLEVRQREDGSKASHFIVTSDPDFNGTEIGDFFGITLAFDLSTLLKVPDVKFLIDVIDYDGFSYKFSRPRIQTLTSNVYVKGIKIYVNGVSSPQHATYTIVDKMTTPTDGKLSDYSMIVLKDKGMTGDHIKFSFDQIVATAPTTTGGAAGGTTGGGLTSLAAFQISVYPISRSSSYSCVSCHRVGPAPSNTWHASDSADTAHTAALNLVDFNTPANSRIVQKMRVSRHNCQAYCDSIATQYENAILEWKNKKQ